jgi:hypothetical protein
MLATISSNLLHKRGYQTLNAYSIVPGNRCHSPRSTRFHYARHKIASGFASGGEPPVGRLIT